MMYGIAFTMWFLGAEGHMTRGDVYPSQTACEETAEAFNKSARKWIIQAACIKSGGSPP